MKTSFFRCRSVLSCVAYAGLAVNLLLTGRVALANERSKPDDNHKATVTFAKDISRILQNRCQTCHHAGTAAPFTLATYKDALHWADTIREVVTQNRMPPWHADPHYGTFSNDRRLTDQEKAAILAWIDGGKPMGDKADLPAPRKFADGWVVGQPDVVFDLPEEQTIPATGVVPYLYFVTPTHFKEDVWVQAAEARPGNRAVVHHIVVSYRDPKLGGRETARGFGDGLVVGEAPGDLPLFLPPGMAIKIPAGAELVWQMHYTPNGKPAKDKSQIGLVFYKGKQPPTRIAHTRGAVNASFAIPAGASNYKVESEWVAPRPSAVVIHAAHASPRQRFPVRRGISGRSIRDPAQRPPLRLRLADELPARETGPAPQRDEGPLHGPFRQFQRQPGESGCREIGHLGRPDLGRNDDRLVRLRLAAAGKRRPGRRLQRLLVLFVTALRRAVLTSRRLYAGGFRAPLDAVGWHWRLARQCFDGDRTHDPAAQSVGEDEAFVASPECSQH
jgi:hypothetical protein